MKKILHLFSDPSHSALWSRYLRMITMIALLAFGSLGGWGKELQGHLGTPAEKGEWNAQTNTYTWNLTQLLRFILVFLANQRFAFLICFTVFYKF